MALESSVGYGITAWLSEVLPVIRVGGRACEAPVAMPCCVDGEVFAFKKLAEAEDDMREPDDTLSPLEVAGS